MGGISPVFRKKGKDVLTCGDGSRDSGDATGTTQPTGQHVYGMGALCKRVREDMHIHYSTADVVPVLRYPWWREVVCRHGILAESCLLKEEPFDGELVSNQVGAVSINRMPGSVPVSR